MAQPMSPSAVTPITRGQMGKFYDVFVVALEKSGLPSEPTQRVLESQGGPLADECVAALRKRVEAISDMIVRHVKNIDRTLTPQQMLDATGRHQYTDMKVVASMPRDGRTEDDVFFFPLRRFASPAEVAEALKFRGLKPDPYAQAKVNIDDPDFANEHLNGCQWQDADGQHCFATFGRWCGGRHVDVYRNDHDWYYYWWVGGVRE